ncbi:MAG: hypothetical protein P4L69_07040 [Desulfosporosinus sp.]|nr:hypothetical protein [Desulfosporosinus sp.]
MSIPSALCTTIPVATRPNSINRKLVFLKTKRLISNAATTVITMSQNANPSTLVLCIPSPGCPQNIFLFFYNLIIQQHLYIFAVLYWQLFIVYHVMAANDGEWYEEAEHYAKDNEHRPSDSHHHYVVINCSHNANGEPRNAKYCQQNRDQSNNSVRVTPRSCRHVYKNEMFDVIIYVSLYRALFITKKNGHGNQVLS